MGQCPLQYFDIMYVILDLSYDALKLGRYYFCDSNCNNLRFLFKLLINVIIVFAVTRMLNMEMHRPDLFLILISLFLRHPCVFSNVYQCIHHIYYVCSHCLSVLSNLQ